MDARSEALRKECYRLVDSCLYTSTSLFIWLRFCRAGKVFFILAPLVFGSLSTWSVLTHSSDTHLRNATALFSFLAGLLPALYAALKLDHHLDQCCKLAGEFKNLQDRFRQAGDISYHKSFLEFSVDVEPLFKRMERARAQSYTPPEWCFKLAQKKINRGDYTHTVDEVTSRESGHPIALQYLAASEDEDPDNSPVTK